MLSHMSMQNVRLQPVQVNILGLMMGAMNRLSLVMLTVLEHVDRQMEMEDH